jgi:hypothetical protein
MPSERVVELLGAQPMGTDGAPERNLVLDEEDEAAARRWRWAMPLSRPSTSTVSRSSLPVPRRTTSVTVR